jgi:hypothetical protein
MYYIITRHYAKGKQSDKIHFIILNPELQTIANNFFKNNDKRSFWIHLVLVDKKFWKRLEFSIVILGGIQSWLNSVEFIKIYWIFPLDLSKLVFKISRVTGFFSMFILSKQRNE